MTEDQKSNFEVITVANAKGGAGKSTFTMLLGSAALSAGSQVVFMDTDPQGTLKNWWTASKAAGNFPDRCIGFDPSSTTEVMDKLNQLDDSGYEGIVLIDTTGVGDKSTLELVNVSDCVVVPCMISEPARTTTVEVLEFLRDHMASLEEGHRPLLRLVRNAVPKMRDRIKAHKAIFDELGAHPECMEAYVHRHNLLEVWSNEGPLYTRFQNQKESGTLEVGQAKNTLAVLEEGIAIINEIFEAED